MAIVNSTADMQDLGGGKFRNTIQISPVHYFANGLWRKIENSLGNSGDQNFTIGVDELMQFRIRGNLRGNAPVLHIGYGGEHVRLTPLNTNDVNAVVVGNSVSFPEAWNNADLRITVAGHIIKKEIILRSGHPASFAFRIDEKAYESKLIEHKPYLKRGRLYVQLAWLRSMQGGKEILTAVLPEGDWSGWVLDPTYTSQPDDTTGYDTYAENDAPYDTQNFDGNNIFIGEVNVGAAVARSFIKFDMSSIPSSATINSGTCTLKIAVDYSSNARTFEMHRILRDWVETELTWVRWKVSNNWTTGGCGGAGTDYDNTVVHGSASFTATESVGTAKDFSLNTTELKKMIDGTNPNYGWRFAAQTESNDAYEFYDSSDATSTNRPKLVIDYTEASLSNMGAFFPLLG